MPDENQAQPPQAPATPAPAAQPAPVMPPATVPVAKSSVEGEGLTAEEEKTLVDLTAKAAAAAAGDGAVQMRVEGEHSSMYYGGVLLTGDWTPVPAHMVAPVFEAAANGGVTVTQKEEG